MLTIIHEHLEEIVAVLLFAIGAVMMFVGGTSLVWFGAAIGGRNHATVLHSCKAVSNLLETDKAFRRQVEEIEKQVLA